MIRGIGVDIVKISRIKISQARRILSEEETLVFDQLNLESKKIEYLAGRFSVKEALMKALSSTNYIVGMRDITILNEEKGKPYVKKPVFEDLKILVSISHEQDNCVGLCVIENV